MPNEIEQFQIDQEIAEKALNNAYNLIIGTITLEELFVQANQKNYSNGEVYLPFDPHVNTNFSKVSLNSFLESHLLQDINLSFPERNLIFSS